MWSVLLTANWFEFGVRCKTRQNMCAERGIMLWTCRWISFKNTLQLILSLSLSLSLSLWIIIFVISSRWLAMQHIESWIVLPNGQEVCTILVFSKSPHLPDCLREVSTKWLIYQKLYNLTSCILPIDQRVSLYIRCSVWFNSWGFRLRIEKVLDGSPIFAIEQFNNVLCRTRMTIEQTFGILKKRSPCLQIGMYIDNCFTNII